MRRKKSNSASKKNIQDSQRFTNVIELSFHQQPKKKTTTFQRLSQKHTEITKNIGQKMKNNLKVQRKDTASTTQENNIQELKNSRNYDSSQLNKLVEQSKQDPFIRHKLKAFVKSEIKTLVKGNKEIENLNNSFQIKNIQTDKKLQQEQILKLLSDTVIFAGSLKQSSELGSSQSLSNKSKGPSTPLCDRLVNQFFWEDSNKDFIIKTQSELPSHLTTLKSEQNKNKTSKFKFLRLLSLKDTQQFLEK